MPKKIPETADTPANYEAAAQELEALVRQMEAAQLPLDQLLASYQRGAFLLHYCQAKLQALEQQVSSIDNGQLKPWLNPS
ncbi:MAG: exodeoxyribonuclease VII small subunit [Cytophagales bacterium]|nr:exodeoxyribonuclease VII small subunit [Cytophagales bacterium]